MPTAASPGRPRPRRRDADLVGRRADEPIPREVVAGPRRDGRPASLPSSVARTDADIAAAVVRVLELDASVPLENLDVSVSKGWVTLEGEVEWQHQKQDAEGAVRRLSGVTGVSNLIIVKPRVSAEDLKEKIEHALVRSAETDAERIAVESRGAPSS